MTAHITPALARKACELWAAEQSVQLFWPGDPVREAVLYAMAAVHKLSGSGWSLEHARENVSVTLPGAGSPALDLLEQIPYAGSFLKLAAARVEHPFICFSPAAARDGVALMATMSHEMGHVGSIRAGGLGWCIAYGLVPEARAAGEAPCYGAGMAVYHRLGGHPTATLVGLFMKALEGYGLDEDAKKLAHGILLSNAASLDAGADPGGVAAEAVAALTAAGWKP